MATVSPNVRKYASVATVALYVGEARIRFLVHLDPLCEASDFFKVAFTGQFKEGVDHEMDLPEDNVDTVNLFIHWLYTRQYDLPLPSDGESFYDCNQPLQLVVFADKYSVPVVKATILAKLLSYAQGDRSLAPTNENVEYAYQNTCCGSSIRRLMADWHACNVNTAWFRGTGTQDWLPTIPEFAIDLVASMAILRDNAFRHKTFKAKTPEDYLSDTTNAVEKKPE